MVVERLVEEASDNKCLRVTMRYFEYDFQISNYSLELNRSVTPIVCQHIDYMLHISQLLTLSTDLNSKGKYGWRRPRSVQRAHKMLMHLAEMY